MDTRTVLDKEGARPLYDQLKDRLVEQIAGGRVSIDGRIPSEEKLAKLYGVSRMTARQALRALAEEVPLVRLKGKGTFLAACSSGRTRRKLDYVRIIVPPWTSPSRSGDFYLRIFHAAEEEARKNDIDVIFSSLDDKKKVLSGVENTEGVIFVGLLGVDCDRELVARGIPTAFVDGHGSDLPEASKFDVDSEGAARIAVLHLADMGHRRIGLLTIDGRYETPAFVERRRAYQEALAERGLPSFDACAQRISWQDLEGGARRAADAFLSLGSNAPTAVFAADPVFAMLLLAEFARRGARVPEDMSLITLGDVDAMRYTAPPISGVRLFEEELGRLAVRQIILQAETPEAPGVRRVAPVEIVSRASVKRLEP